MLIHAWYAKQWCWRTYKIQKSLFLHSFANECALPTRSTFSIARNASSNHADQQFSISKMTAHWHCANNMTTTRLFIIKKKTVLQILCNETSTDFSLCIFTRWRSLISSAVFLALVTRLKQRRWWYTGLIKLVGPIRCCYQMDTCMLMKVPSCTHCKRFWNETSQTSVATLHPTSTVHDLKCAW